MTILSLSSATTVSACETALRRDGCVIVRNLESDEKMDAIQSELTPYLARTPFGEGPFMGFETKRIGALILKSPATHELLLHPLILGVVNSILGPHCSRIQLNLTQAVQIWPGEVEQSFHRDDELFPYPNKQCEFMINALWAYDAFTRENGATRIVVGSHRDEVTRNPDPSRIEYAVMPRGSVLMYLGSAIHSGGANRSEHPRTAIINSYSLGWLRQAENLYLSVPPRAARALPVPLQQLVGYAIHAPNLGWYEGQDPSVALHEHVPDTLAARDYFSPGVHDRLLDRRSVLKSAGAE